MKISLNEGLFGSKLYLELFNILEGWVSGNITAAVCESIYYNTLVTI